MPASQIQVPGSSPASTSEPASCYCVWEVAYDSQSCWIPAVHMGDQDGVQSSWL